MNTKPLHIETIDEYDKLLGIETFHPLVSVVDMAQARRIRHMRHSFGFYAVSYTHLTLPTNCT